MVHVFIVSEFSVFRLLLSSFFRRRILILTVEPFLPGTKRLLDFVVNALVHNKKAQRPIDIYPELNRIKALQYRCVFFDIFPQTIAWHNKYFKISNTDRGSGNYIAANKKAILNHMSFKEVTLLSLREILRAGKGETYKCIGFPADTFAAAEYYCKTILCGSPAWIPTRLVNFALFGAILTTSLLWVFFRTRLRRVDPKNFFFAADFIADDRDIRLYKELEEGGDLLMVSRNSEFEKSSLMKEQISKHTYCKRGDGLLALGDIIPMLKMIITDEWHVFRQFNSCYPTLFRRLMALPYRRLLYRGLFLRYKPKVFWGRDPYNEDHIIRRQELHRIGGRSWGVNTATINSSIMLARNLFVSFDRYYIFGHSRYQKYYGDTWAKDMKLVPAGSFTAERKHYACRFDYRPPDIALFTAAYISEPELVDLVRGLAQEFPERKIILQVRESYRHLAWAIDFISECREGFKNIELATDSVYDIFLRARYGISDPSSVVSEAMQFGMVSFSFDLPHLQVANVDREFPGLTVNSADDVINRIRKIEGGEWRYPIDQYQDVVDMSGTVFFDRIREDMGLKPQDDNPAPLITNYQE